MASVTLDQAADFRPVYTRQNAPQILQTHDDAIARARALQPHLRERALETEQLRRLHSDNIADLLDTGLYGLMTPERIGGSDLGSETMIDGFTR